MKTKFLAAVVVSTLALPGLAQDVTYRKDIQPMLKAMCAQMYYEYLKGYKWFVESEYALSSGESKSDTAVLLKQREEVPLARHYSLFSAIEDSHRDVFGMSTDGANPGDILRMMN